MRRKCVVCSIILLLVFSMTGCTKAYDLTEEEQVKIANYAAHVMAKYNRRQEKGLERITQEDLDKAEEKEKKPENTNAENVNADNSDDSDDVQNVTLAEALHLEQGLDASFVKYDVTETYVQEEYFLLNATSGRQFLVLHVNLKANEQDVACDMYQKDLNYQVVINQNKKVSAQTSILLNDLGTYQGTIAAGSSQECVLLFETEAENLQNIEQLQLKVSSGSTKSVVNLK